MFLCETLHENIIQYFEFCVIKQLQVFQVHIHRCICFLFFWLSTRKGLLDPTGILWQSHFEACLVWFVFLPRKFANPPQAACKPALPVMAECLGLKLHGPRGLRKTFPFELCFCRIRNATVIPKSNSTSASQLPNCLWQRNAVLLVI